jgi:PAS domain S-box-containing protein
MIFKGRIKKKIALKEIQRESSDPKAYLEGIMSSVVDFLMVVNPEGALRSVNKAVLDLLGYKEDELIGQPMTKIILQEEKEEESVLDKYFSQIIVAGVTHNIGLTFLTKQGGAIPVTFSAAVMQQNGKITGIVGAARDMRQIMAVISDLQKKNSELEESAKDSSRMQRAMLHMMGDLDIAKKEMEKANKELQKLDRLDQLKSDFVCTVSHELRTPLTVTREAISQLLDGVYGEIKKEQEQLLFMSIEGIDRLSRLVENLLDISKIEARKCELKKELIDIVSLAKEVSLSFASAFRCKGLEAKCHMPMDKIELYVDKDRIIQVFVNLIDNAVKFTPAGYIEISIVDKENVVECAVSDSGIGISDKDLPRVFDKFQQFGREFGSAEKGTGLGLPISKGIIELHRGTIWVESKLGQGSKTSFILPKYGPVEFFKEYVTNGIGEAIKEGVSLSIIIFEVKICEPLQEKLGQDKIAPILHNLGQLIKTNVRPKSYMGSINSRAFWVALPETGKQGAGSTAERLKSSCDDYLSKEKLAKEIEIEFRLASFSEDGNTEEELLNKLQL